MKPLLFTLTLALAGAVQAQEFNDSARVLSATPVYEQVNSPRRECWTEYRETSRREQRGGNNIGGAIVGGVVGGLLGNQVGGGHGKEVATAGGAIAGAIIGNQVQTRDDYRRDDDHYRPVDRCSNRDQWERRLTGYEVRYEYRGHTYQSFMQRDPGERIPVRVTMDVTPR